MPTRHRERHPAAQSAFVTITLCSNNKTGVRLVAAKRPPHYLPGAPKLNIHISGSNAVVSWSASGYILQESTSVLGPFTNINSATSPYPVALSSAKHLFFRLAP